MAPSPETDKEPKAPDKSSPYVSENIPIETQLPMIDALGNSEVRTGAAANADIEDNAQLESLDDGQLRALLDEAITYKCPKDREGKSLLFNELLEEAEQDEEARGMLGGRGGGSRSGGGRRSGRARSPHSGSLQDLAAAALYETAPRRRTHNSAKVSARAHHGGSLPSGVDRHSSVEHSFPFTEEVSGRRPADYIATVRCVNPPPLSERRVSVCEEYGASDTDPTSNDTDGRSSKLPRIPITYTTRATLEIGSSGANSNGRGAHTTTTCSQVDTGLSFGCISTPAVVPSTVVTSMSTLENKTRYGMINSSLGSLATFRGAYSITTTGSGLSATANPAAPTAPAAAATAADDIKKSLDENGNALQSFNSSLSGSSHKKIRRKKSTKNETVAISDQIDGYQGDKGINELLRFIDPTADHVRPNHRGQFSRMKNKDDNEEKHGKKRSTERKTKDKIESKMKKANSLEELSLSKLEDLTDNDLSKHDAVVVRKNKKNPANENINETRKRDRRSWGNDTQSIFNINDTENLQPTLMQTPSSQEPKHEGRRSKHKEGEETEPMPYTESLEFQTVMKKKRIKKRHSPHDDYRGRNHGPVSGKKSNIRGTLLSKNRNLLYSKFKDQNSPDRRRKSASSVPPSEKSNDSNDDLDSVHSLPIESTTEKMTYQTVSASGGDTPLTSYADIAKFSPGSTGSPPNQAVISSPLLSLHNQAQPAQNHELPANGKNENKWTSRNSQHSNSTSPPNGADSSSGSSNSSQSGIKSPPASVITQGNTLRGHNIPDLIESCNYYDIPKTLVANENNKNLLHKDQTNNVETQQKYKHKITDNTLYIDNSMNHTYDSENYPTLDAKRNNSHKLKNESKILSKVQSTPVIKNEKRNKERSPKLKEHAPEHIIMMTDQSIIDLAPNNYPSFTKQKSGRVNTEAPFDTNANLSKIGLLHNHLDGIINKPPDVVMPITDITHEASRHAATECLPAVVIMNDNPPRATENVNDIDGITFGFDINEKLLNGDISPTPDLQHLTETIIPAREPVEMLSVPTVQANDLQASGSPSMTIIYNSNSEFPAINEKPHRSRNHLEEHVQHPKKFGRLNKGGGVVVNITQDEGPKSKRASEERADRIIEAHERDACSVSAVLPNLTSVEIVEGRCQKQPLKYQAPPANEELYSTSLEKIVNYVEMAWDDIIKSSGGQVRYFNEK